MEKHYSPFLGNQFSIARPQDACLSRVAENDADKTGRNEILSNYVFTEESGLNPLNWKQGEQNQICVLEGHFGVKVYRMNWDGGRTKGVQ